MIRYGLVAKMVESSKLIPDLGKKVLFFPWMVRMDKDECNTLLCYEPV